MYHDNNIKTECPQPTCYGNDYAEEETKDGRGEHTVVLQQDVLKGTYKL